MFERLKEEYPELVRKDTRKETDERIANPLPGKKSYTPDPRPVKKEKPKR